MGELKILVMSPEEKKKCCFVAQEVLDLLNKYYPNPGDAIPPMIILIDSFEQHGFELKKSGLIVTQKVDQ